MWWSDETLCRQKRYRASYPEAIGSPTTVLVSLQMRIVVGQKTNGIYVIVGVFLDPKIANSVDVDGHGATYET